jgi:CheY-like chemotaxis protein
MSTPDDQDAGRRRILVVDDHRVLVGITQTVLEDDFGYEVAVAYNAAEGVRRAEEFRPHVVLCDISLAGGASGYDVARAVRAMSQRLPALLIAVTGFAAEQVEAASTEAGFDLTLTKPVDFEALHRIIQERLG